MSSTPALRYQTRPMLEIVEEAVAVLRQDAGEYAYIALIGAVPATAAVAVPGVLGGPIAISIIAPLLVLFALATFAASATAFGCVANQLQPDAASAYAGAGRHALSIVRPWLLLMVALWLASYVAATFIGHLGPVPHFVVPLALLVVSGFYAFPRSLSAPAVLDQGLSSRQAAAASAAIVRGQPRRVAVAWALALAPATVVAVLGVLAGFDAINAALAAFFFVGAMPFAGAMMSLLFFEAASQVELAPAPPREARAMPRPAQRRA